MTSEDIYERINDDFFKSLIANVAVNYKVAPKDVKKWKMKEIIEANNAIIWHNVAEKKYMDEMKNG